MYIIAVYGPDKIILGADARDGRISTSGWLHDSEMELIITAGTEAACRASMSAIEPTPPLAITYTDGSSFRSFVYMPIEGPAF